MSCTQEDILKLGMTKLALDNAVAGEGEEEGESAPEKAMKSSLMSMLRKKFDNEGDAEAVDEKPPNGSGVSSVDVEMVSAESVSTDVEKVP